MALQALVLSVGEPLGFGLGGYEMIDSRGSVSGWASGLFANSFSGAILCSRNAIQFYIALLGFIP